MKIKELNVVESSTPTDVIMLYFDLPINALLMHDANLVHNWTLDSGTSFHIISQREWFSAYSDGSFGTIRIGDAHALAITGIVIYAWNSRMVGNLLCTTSNAKIMDPYTLCLYLV